MSYVVIFYIASFFSFLPLFLNAVVVDLLLVVTPFVFPGLDEFVGPVGQAYDQNWLVVCNVYWTPVDSNGFLFVCLFFFTFILFVLIRCSCLSTAILTLCHIRQKILVFESKKWSDWWIVDQLSFKYYTFSFNIARNLWSCVAVFSAWIKSQRSFHWAVEKFRIASTILCRHSIVLYLTSFLSCWWYKSCASPHSSANKQTINDENPTSSWTLYTRVIQSNKYSKIQLFPWFDVRVLAWFSSFS